MTDTETNGVGGQPRRCSYMTPGGIECHAPPMQGADRCWFHSEDPDIVLERKEGLSRGGKARIHAIDGWKPARIASIDDLRRVLVRLFNATVSGELSPKVANSAALIAGILLRSLDIGDLEKRLEAVELALENKRD